MTEKFEAFDPVDYLDSPEQIEAYLRAAKEEGDPEFYKDALELAKLAKQRLNAKKKVLKFPSFDLYRFNVGPVYNNRHAYGAF